MLSAGPNRELTYWLREGKSANAEVDFVVAFDDNIVPVEVKSGTGGGLKSVHQFAGEKEAKLAIRFDTGMPSVQKITTAIRKHKRASNVEYQLVSLPLYLVERLPELIPQLN
jgi:hypothetical protein